MKKSEKKDNSRPRQLEQRTGPVEVKDVVSFNQAMGRVVAQLEEKGVIKKRDQATN